MYKRKIQQTSKEGHCTIIKCHELYYCQYEKCEYFGIERRKCT